MKVILVNGSPHRNGNTYQSLKYAADILEGKGIETEIINVGSLKITGCHACGGCKDGMCVIDDGFSEPCSKFLDADAVIVGSPVYYAGINGTLKSFLDRAFYCGSAKMRFKPVAAITVARRTGISDTYQTIYNYFTFAEMLIAPTPYWPGIHGGAHGECMQDEEGLQILRSIANNIAYLLEIKEKSGVPVPEKEAKIKYSFIR